MQHMDRAGRDQAPDGGEVRTIEGWHRGGAEIEALRVHAGQVENPLQVEPGGVGRDHVAGDRGVLGEGGLHVHGEHVGQVGVEQLLHHLRPHAVGVQLEGQPGDALEVGQEGGQARGRGGLAAGHGQAVQPAGAVLEPGQHLIPVQDGMALGPPGQAGVVAGGAGQVAPAQEEHRAHPAGPVAKAGAGEAPQGVPRRKRIRHALRPGRFPFPLREARAAPQPCRDIPGRRPGLAGAPHLLTRAMPIPLGAAQQM